MLNDFFYFQPLLFFGPLSKWGRGSGLKYFFLFNVKAVIFLKSEHSVKFSFALSVAHSILHPKVIFRNIMSILSKKKNHALAEKPSFFDIIFLKMF